MALSVMSLKVSPLLVVVVNVHELLNIFCKRLPGWAGWYTCLPLRLYQFGPVRVPECNHKVTGNSFEAVYGCEAVKGYKAKIGVKAEHR